VPLPKNGATSIDSLQAPKLVAQDLELRNRAGVDTFSVVTSSTKVFGERFDLRLDYFDSRVIQEKCIHLLKVVCAEDVVAVHDGEELEARIAKVVDISEGSKTSR
jgi:hypothetical protein